MTRHPMLFHHGILALIALPLAIGSGQVINPLGVWARRQDALAPDASIRDTAQRSK